MPSPDFTPRVLSRRRRYGGVLLAAAFLLPVVLATLDTSTPLRVMVGFSSQADQQLLRKYHASAVHGLDTLGVVVADVQSGLVPWLRSERGVAYVEADSVAHIAGDIVDWSVSWIKADQAWGITTGRSVKVAVLDTGVDLTHPDLAANIRGCISFVGSHSNDCTDRAGHGTGVAGIIAATRNEFGMVGVAYDVELYAVKVLGDDGTGYYSDIIEGIQWASSQGIPIISMSLGGSTDSLALSSVVKNAYAAGTLLVAAAGNSGPNENSVLYPAKYPEVIAVGALDQMSYNVAYFSSRGPEVELAAPGTYVYTTKYNGTYTYFGGTSAAAPFVSATAALIKAASPTLSNTMIRDVMDSTAMDLGDAGRDIAYGYGMVDALRAVQSAPSPPPQVVDVAVDSIALPGEVTQGSTMSATVQVGNRGTQPATITVSLSDETDRVLLGSRSVTLYEKAIQDMDFTVDTSSMTLGVHMISAQAATLPGEVDTEDNTRQVTVKVTPQPVIDVAVKSLALPSQVTQGLPLNITLEVANEGSQLQTFTVTVRDETYSAILGSHTVTLGGGVAQTIDFRCDTSSMAASYHSIGAQAEPLPNEADIADNARSGSIQVVAVQTSAPKLVIYTATDKANYTQGSYAVLTVLVRDGGGVYVGGASVKITVLKPNGSPYYARASTTNSQGISTFYISIRRYIPKGTYTVLIEAARPGYEKCRVTVTFMVVR